MTTTRRNNTCLLSLMEVDATTGTVLIASGVTLGGLALMASQNPRGSHMLLYLTQNRLARKTALHLSTILLFGGVYSYLDKDSFAYPAHTEKDAWTSNSMYYSAVTHTTLGFGEIVPKSGAARIATVVHALTVLLLLST